METEKVLELRY